MLRRFYVSLIALAIIGLYVPSVTAVCDNTNCDKGVITISYSAEKEVSPDTVEISIAIRTSDKKSMSVAANKNKEISDRVYQNAKTYINTKDGDYIKTSNYSASPSYLYKDGKREFEKYNVSNNVIIHTKSIEKIAEIIDKSLDLGATDVNNLNFSLSEKDAQCNELISKAAKNSKLRADIVASATGTTIAGVKHIDVSCSLNQGRMVNYSRNMVMSAKAMDSAEAAGPTTAIEAGVIKIYSNINATYYVK